MNNHFVGVMKVSVPGPPVCLRKWSAFSLTSLTIDWEPPNHPNGIITGYFLELVSFDNATVLQSANVLNTLNHTFTGSTIGMVNLNHKSGMSEKQIFLTQLLEFPIMFECMQRTQMAEEIIVSLLTLVIS